MKHLLTCIIILLCAAGNASAQKFLEDLQKKQQGQGTVTVTQSKEITELVNGKPPVKAVTEVPGNNVATTSAANKKPQDDKTAEQKGDSAKTVAEQKKKTNEQTESKATEAGGLDIPVVDTRKKVMVNGYKVTGYRVQVFSGGNTRNDRIKAEQVRDKLKTSFPDEPVYAHFYSPRWVCRMGNYRTFDEANRVCKQVKALGYSQACVIKGKITVQN